MSRKFVAKGSLLFLALFALFAVVTAVTPLSYGSNGTWFRPPCDFSLRMTEIKCLRMGVNPFDVWHGDVVLPPFRPNYGSKVSGPEFTEEINAYAPWEYAFMLPLSFLPRKLAWMLYFAMMGLSLAFVFAIGRAYGQSATGSREDGLIAGAVPVLMVAYPIWSNICIGNFSVIVLAAVVAMAYFLDRDKDVCAGFAWALAMLKPQLGLIFAIPLIMRRKWRTCLVAAGTCAVASIVPSAMCGTPPLTLILQTPAANLFCFKGCGTLPYALCGHLPGNGDVMLAVAIGALACFALSRLIPCDASWLVFLSPAAICATSWTYVSTYGHVLCYFLFLGIVIDLLKDPADRIAWAFFAFAAVFASRAYSAYHGFVSAFGSIWPSLAYPESLHCHIDSLNSTAVLVSASAFFACAGRKRTYPVKLDQPGVGGDIP